MLGHVVLMAAMMGQTAVDSPRTGPVLSEQAKTAQARALAEFRANEHTIKPRLKAYYQLENKRLTERTATVHVATSRVLYFAAGARPEGFGGDGRISGFSSVPPTAPGTPRVYEDPTSLSELQRENSLIKGRLRDSQSLYRQSNQLYWAEWPIRYRLAGTPFGQR